jgi:MerR HTH family regulatory protein
MVSMQQEEFMAADDFCQLYQVETSFINILQEFGLIEVSLVEEKKFIPRDRILELEKFIRLHYDLDINVPGIDAIEHLLQRLNALQAEINDLKNRLRLYE